MPRVPTFPSGVDGRLAFFQASLISPLSCSLLPYLCLLYHEMLQACPPSGVLRISFSVEAENYKQQNTDETHK